jgi:sugar/nucleoside kinase (ribokinase family)
MAHPRGGHSGQAAQQPSQEEGAEPRAASTTVHAVDCRLSAVYVCTLGDLLLDVVVRLDEPIADDTDAYGRIRVGAGGQAANVAAWAAELGARARLLAAYAGDAAGRLLQEELRVRGVELSGCELAEGTGTVVSIATPDGSRSMLADRGIAGELSRGSLEPSALEGCDVLHVTGYSLVREPMRAAALQAAEVARRAGARVSLDVSSVGAARRAGLREFGDACAAAEPDIVFATDDERSLVPSLDAETWVVKRGAAGFDVEGPSGRTAHAALPTDLVDATGAGDALAAGYLVGGPALAAEAAARCVATLGAMP